MTMVRCEEQSRTIVTTGGKKFSLLALVVLHPVEMDLKVTV
ncbi:hypothetical protein [Catellatospora sichuanensis]|nr:hypothetical protein [Catellatospora sichuanensis]